MISPLSLLPDLALSLLLDKTGCIARTAWHARELLGREINRIWPRINHKGPDTQKRHYGPVDHSHKECEAGFQKLHGECSDE